MIPFWCTGGGGCQDTFSVLESIIVRFGLRGAPLGAETAVDQYSLYWSVYSKLSMNIIISQHNVLGIVMCLTCLRSLNYNGLCVLVTEGGKNCNSAAVGVERVETYNRGLDVN